MERGEGKDEETVKRGGFTVKVSYIKGDGGREKIRALLRKVARQVLKEGTLIELEYRQ